MVAKCSFLKIFIAITFVSICFEYSCFEVSGKKTHYQRVIKNNKSKGKTKNHKNRIKSRTDIFLKWLLSDELSTIDENIIIKDLDNNERGIYSKSNVEIGEHLAEININKIITLKNAKELPIWKQISGDFYKLHSPTHSLLAIFLLQEEKNENSIWKGYFEILPKKLNNIPIFFSEDELKFLEETSFLDVVTDQRKEMLMDYNKLKELSEDFGKFSFNEFKRARMLAASRNFSISTKEGQTSALVPFADMLNHSLDQQTRWFFDVDLDAFVIKATKPIKDGEEIFDTYGIKSNHRYFLNYGFLIDNNNVDRKIFFKVPIPDNLPISKKEIVSKFKLDNKFELKYPHNKSPLSVSNDLLSLVRLLLDDFEVTQEIKDMKHFYFNIKIIDPEIEKRMLRYFQKIINEKLNKFSTTIEDDKILLLNEGISYNEKNCIKTRINEKEILKIHSDFADHFLQIYESGDKKTIKIIMKNSYMGFTVSQ